MRNAGLRGGNQTQSRMRRLPARHSGEGPSRPPAPRARGHRPGGRGAPAGAWFCAGASGSAGSCPFSAMRTLFSEKSRDDEGIRRARLPHAAPARPVPRGSPEPPGPAHAGPRHPPVSRLRAAAQHPGPGAARHLAPARRPGRTWRCLRRTRGARRVSSPAWPAPMSSASHCALTGGDPPGRAVCLQGDVIQRHPALMGRGPQWDDD